MRCHYEVLEVERTADDDEIKKAYRKLALKWHPDKNPDRIEECNQMFALLQQAYEVLSDPQERAWYDRHRDRILRGGFDEEYKDNSINIFPYSSSACYSGFGDDEKGFYAVYRHVFETLASEDYEFLEDALVTYPGFGDSTSDYEQVAGPFYGFWQSFSTARSFSWLDEYEIRDAPNRYVVRQMEKENKKMREAGKKERNEEIRHLAEYVRKRDKRVTEYKKVLEERRLEQERKNEEHRRNMILERNRQLGEYKESEEVKKKHQETLAEIEEALDAQFGTVDGLEEGSGLDDEGDVQPLYCIVCEKAFKTPRAMSNHEKSKKHREAVEELKKHMQEEDLVLLEDEQRDEAVDDDDAPKASSKKTKKQRRRDRRKADLDLDDSDNPDNGEGETTSLNGELNEMTIGEQSTQGDEVNGNVDYESNIFLKMAKAQVKAAEQEGKKKTRRRDNISDDKGSQQQASGPRAGTCDKCGEVFESKTKLFTHLKTSGHATLLAGPALTNGTARTGKRGKRK